MKKPTTSASKSRAAKSPRVAIRKIEIGPVEFHCHPNVIQIHDGRDGNPAAIMQSPRGDGVALTLIACILARSVGAKVRTFDAAGKES